MCICGDWSGLNLGNGWSVSEGYSVAPSVKIDCLGIVHFKGVLAGESGTWAFSLSDEFRPDRLVILLVPVIIKDTNVGDYGSVALATIDPNGVCWISPFYPIRSASFTYVYLDGISFVKDA